MGIRPPQQPVKSTLFSREPQASAFAAAVSKR